MGRDTWSDEGRDEGMGGEREVRREGEGRRERERGTEGERGEGR